MKSKRCNAVKLKLLTFQFYWLKQSEEFTIKNQCLICSEMSLWRIESRLFFLIICKIKLS